MIEIYGSHMFYSPESPCLNPLMVSGKFNQSVKEQQPTSA